MLTGIKTKMTFHHLIKKEHNGSDTASNGALLINEIHQWLHASIEMNDEDLYDLITECLLLYKKCKNKNIQRLIELYETECMPEFKKVVENDKVGRTLTKKKKH